MKIFKPTSLNKYMAKTKTRKIILYSILAIASFLILIKTTNLCALVGGLWCYNPLESVNKIINLMLVIIILFFIWKALRVQHFQKER